MCRLGLWKFLTSTWVWNRNGSSEREGCCMSHTLSLSPSPSPLSFSRRLFFFCDFVKCMWGNTTKRQQRIRWIALGKQVIFVLSVSSLLKNLRCSMIACSLFKTFQCWQHLMRGNFKLFPFISSIPKKLKLKKTYLPMILL